MNNYINFNKYSCMGIILACMGLTTACSSDKEEEIIDGPATVKKEKVTFTASLNGTTRAGETYFDSGDAISIFAFNGGEGETIDFKNEDLAFPNVKYVYNGSNFESDDPILKKENEALAYAAIYPYSPSNAFEFDFTIIGDQSDYANYTASDLCVVMTNAFTSPNVNLNFYHRLSHLKVELTGFNIAGVIDAKIVNVLATANVNLHNINFQGDINGATTDLIPYLEGSTTYKAILPPQTISKGQKILEVTINGRLFEVESPQDFVLKSGKEYQLNVSLINGSLVVSDGHINPWEDEYID